MYRIDQQLLNHVSTGIWEGEHVTTITITASPDELWCSPRDAFYFNPNGKSRAMEIGPCDKAQPLHRSVA